MKKKEKKQEIEVGEIKRETKIKKEKKKRKREIGMYELILR